MAFSLLLLVFSYSIGITIGCLMGYLGGTFDLVIQRIIEVLSNINILYLVMIVSSLVVPNFLQLTLILVAFGWMGMTWYMRSATYKEKERDYVLAARSIGAGPGRIVFRHILPNTISIVITFIPFSVSSGIITLTSLDYLGYGLPVPTPSWGELLRQGNENLSRIWIAGSVIVSMTMVLTMVTFVGEAVREAFDPRRHTVYE
jgi:microcin C transport system permease protein